MGFQVGEYRRQPFHSPGRSFWSRIKPLTSHSGDAVQFAQSSQLCSNSWQLHGLQHARFPCPSLHSGNCFKLCLLSWWCHIQPIYLCHSFLSSFFSIRFLLFHTSGALHWEPQLQHLSSSSQYWLISICRSMVWFLCERAIKLHLPKPYLPESPLHTKDRQFLLYLYIYWLDYLCNLRQPTTSFSLHTNFFLKIILFALAFHLSPL